jgi:hypothetical protein
VHSAANEGGTPEPWLIVRGMSDDADSRKDDSRHASAAGNAAEVFCGLLPHLL